MHDLTDEQREIRDLARRFADEVVAPQAPQWDREHIFPKDVLAQMGELGLLGACIPADHGGAGADFVAYVLALEEISRGDAGLGTTFAVHVSAGQLPILAHGTPEQIDRLIPPAAQGHELCAFALTESGSGSDAAAMLTRAGDDARITGTKQWITNGSYAHTFNVFARDGEKISAYIVRRGAEGFSVTREEEKLGQHSSSTADLAFDNTPSERLGPPGAGMRIALSTLDGGRIGIAAQAVGIAQAALDVAAAYAKERTAFGRPIAGFQAISHRLADMQTRLDAARLLTWRAAMRYDGGRRASKEASMAKVYASEAAMFCTWGAVQTLGGWGYSREYPVEKWFRDAKLEEIWEGTSDIQRLIIARALQREGL